MVWNTFNSMKNVWEPIEWTFDMVLCVQMSCQPIGNANARVICVFRFHIEQCEQNNSWSRIVCRSQDESTFLVIKSYRCYRFARRGGGAGIAWYTDKTDQLSARSGLQNKWSPANGWNSWMDIDSLALCVADKLCRKYATSLLSLLHCINVDYRWWSFC